MHHIKEVGALKLIPNSKSGARFIEIEGETVARECTVCNEIKKLSEFGVDKKAFAGRRAICGKCVSRRYASRTINEKEKYKQAKREWRERTGYKPNPIRKVIRESRRRARISQLADDLTIDQYHSTMSHFSGVCSLSGESENVELDHVLPLAIGRGGTTMGNMLPLRRDLNKSKSDKNIFEWFRENKAQFGLCEERFKTAITFLSSTNKMTTEEYQIYVYWCHNNPRQQ